jgi:hypothetical protein
MAAGTKAAVMSALKDPSSAQFGDRFAAAEAESGNIAICGTVNGKNGFGAYSGISTFAVKYKPATGGYDLLGIDGQDGFCRIVGAKDFSSTPPASVLASQGIKPQPGQ